LKQSFWNEDDRLEARLPRQAGSLSSFHIMILGTGKVSIFIIRAIREIRGFYFPTQDYEMNLDAIFLE
jgi:hypothetical protein